MTLFSKKSFYAGKRSLATLVLTAAVFSAEAMIPVSVDAQSTDNEGPLTVESCSIQVISPGALAPNIGNTALSSKEQGGIAGTAIVTSRKFSRGRDAGPAFAVTFEAPNSFASAPAGGISDISFSARFSGTAVSNGGANFAERSGSQRRNLRRIGTTETMITGHVIATKNSGTFPAGYYSAEAVLRCE